MPWIHGRLSWTLLASTVAHASVLLLWPVPVVPLPVALSVSFLPAPLPLPGGDAPPGSGLVASPPRPAAVSRPAAVPPAAVRPPTLAALAGEPSLPVVVPPVRGPAAGATPATGRPPGASPAVAGPDSSPAAAQAAPAGAPHAMPAAAPLLGGATSGEAVAGGAAADEDLYRGTLVGHARRMKRYPPLARERGWQGTVEVEVSDHGAVPLFRVRRSSGHALLDQQALDLMAQAARLVIVPESLRRTGFRFVVPVEYRLDD